MEKLKSLISPKQNRIKSVESKSDLKFCVYHLLGSTESIIRGFLIGGGITTLFSNDIKNMITGGVVGVCVDIIDYNERLKELQKMKKESFNQYKTYLEGNLI